MFDYRVFSQSVDAIKPKKGKQPKGEKMSTSRQPLMQTRIFPSSLRAIIVGTLLVLWATTQVLANEDVVRPLLTALGDGSAETLSALTKLKFPLTFLSIFTLGVATVLRRREPLGGWLQFFYLSWAAGAFISAFQFPDTLEGILHPSAWKSSKLYAWGLADTATDVLVHVVTLSAATLLLICKQQRYIRVLCAALIANIVCRIILQIGLTLVSPDAQDALTETTTNISALIASTAWYLYFVNSARIRLLYVEHAWAYELQRQQVGRLKLPDRIYIVGRAAIAAAIIVAMCTAVFATVPPFSEGKVQDILLPILIISGWPAIIGACISCFAPTSVRIKLA